MRTAPVIRIVSPVARLPREAKDLEIRRDGVEVAGGGKESRPDRYGLSLRLGGNAGSRIIVRSATEDEGKAH